MIIGVGTDIVKIERIKRSMASDSFMQFTYTAKERELAASRANGPAYFAKLFAGKEALFKAMHMPAASLKHWNCFEITDGKNGEPSVALHREAADRSVGLSVQSVQLSLSYEDDYAVAFAVLEG